MSGYLRRNDVGYPTRPNPRGIYAIKTLENEDLADLQDAVNAYLFALPDATSSWSPHIVSVQYANYIGTGTPPPPTPVPQTIAITFGDAKKNKFLRLGNELMADDNGFVVPYDANISIITASQKDPDSADIDYLVNGVVVETLVMDAMTKTFAVDIDVVAGDIISAENTSNQDLKESTFTMLLTYTTAVPAPLTPPPEFKHVCVITIFAAGTVTASPTG